MPNTGRPMEKLPLEPAPPAVPPNILDRAQTDVSLRAMIEDVLRRAAQHRADAPPPVDAIRASARLICKEARQRGLRAEQLVVMIKAVCAFLPEARAHFSIPGADEPLSQIISICVDEYYNEDAMRR